MKSLAWKKLSRPQLEKRIDRAVGMLVRIAGEQEVWSVYQLKKLLAELTAGVREEANND